MQGQRGTENHTEQTALLRLSGRSCHVRHNTLTSGKEIIIRQTAPDTVVIPRSSQDILCRYLYANMSERNLGILLCLFTGMRVGEICALKWEDFSFQEKSIHVHNTMQRLQIPDSTTAQKTRIMVTSPKNSSSQVL